MVRSLDEIIGANDRAHFKAEGQAFDVAVEVVDEILLNWTTTGRENYELIGERNELIGAIQQILIGRV